MKCKVIIRENMSSTLEIEEIIGWVDYGKSRGIGKYNINGSTMA